MKIRKDDIVVVEGGVHKRERGYRGKVLKVFPKTERVIVEGANLRKKHMKSDGMNRQAGIIDIEGSIHISNVALYCDKCKKGVRTGKMFLADGKKVRYCKQCGEIFDN
ncbi:MAG: 50S ribosomal protein L24 [Eubacteriaceae bacterium]|jgi:large subunit ribosomal protein L24|nr:50S ribosomal protein L24 [Eubacteriaceae bacterium]